MNNIQLNCGKTMFIVFFVYYFYINFKNGKEKAFLSVLGKEKAFVLVFVMWRLGFEKYLNVNFLKRRN